MKNLWFTLLASLALCGSSFVFNENGEVKKMSQVFKVEDERIMNDLAYALVDYLMK